MNTLRMVDTIAMTTTTIGFIIQMTLDHWGVYFVIGGLIVLIINQIIKALMKKKVS